MKEKNAFLGFQFKSKTGLAQLTNQLTFWRGICRSALFQTFLVLFSISFSSLEFAKMDTDFASLLTCECYRTKYCFRAGLETDRDLVRLRPIS